MTKPILTGSIKIKVPSWRKFNLLLETVDLIFNRTFACSRHFFDYENATPKQKICNEIYPPIIEKHKILDANERPVYQLIQLYSETDKCVPSSYRHTPKAHATLFSKKAQPLYLEHLKTLIGRAGRKVTKLYAHYTFEQERFKKDFILMNQAINKQPKTASKKIFTSF